VAKYYLKTPLIKTNAKDLFFKSALCFLANDDLIGAKRAINNYKIDDPHFDSSRELELLEGMLDAIEQKSE
jgi:alpha-soluble NSF attachment protein